MSKCKDECDYTPTAAIVRIPDNGDACDSQPEDGERQRRDGDTPRGRRMLVFLDMICIVLGKSVAILVPRLVGCSHPHLRVNLK